jgi:hypothetical protein
MPVSRRTFVAATVGAAALGASRARASQPDPTGDQAPFSPITPDAEARAIVGASHNNIDRVGELLAARPSLATASIDWGFGDWESALGAASHVGRPDIAELLIRHGARPDIFTLAMQGNLDAVRAAIESAPGLQRVRGPHSLTLAHHARAGGEAAARVVEYLSAIEGADDALANLPVDDAGAILGRYRLVSGVSGVFTIAQGRRFIEFQMEGHSNRNLLHQGGLEFQPAGADGVRFRFAPGAGPENACALEIDMGGRTLRAERTAA